MDDTRVHGPGTRWTVRTGFRRFWGDGRTQGDQRSRGRWDDEKDSQRSVAPSRSLLPGSGHPLHGKGPSGTSTGDSSVPLNVVPRSSPRSSSQTPLPGANRGTLDNSRPVLITTVEDLRGRNSHDIPDEEVKMSSPLSESVPFTDGLQ